MLVTASANRELDDIIDFIGVNLQLTETQFKRAKRAYESLGEELLYSESEVAVYDPAVLHQGSMLYDTTVKPIRDVEYDLDLILLLQLYHHSPLAVYDFVHEQLTNTSYADRLTPKARCFRLKYAGQFHLDVIPAIPDAELGGTMWLIPDKELRIWRPSNPLGFAKWLEERASVRVFVEAKHYVKPLAAPVPAYKKQPLKLAIQLLKRWRDIAFQGREELAVSSIVLTTLAGHLYGGEEHPTDALTAILDGIYLEACNGPIRLRNPANYKEWITDRWNDAPEAYEAFIDEVMDFRVRWHKLLDKGQFPRLVDDLKGLFGELPVSQAIKAYGASRREAREQNRLFMDSRTKNVVVKGTSAAVTGATKMKDHTFYGDE